MDQYAQQFEPHSLLEFIGVSDDPPADIFANWDKKLNKQNKVVKNLYHVTYEKHSVFETMIQDLVDARSSEDFFVVFDVFYNFKKMRETADGSLFLIDQIETFNELKVRFDSLVEQLSVIERVATEVRQFYIIIDSLSIFTICDGEEFDSKLLIKTFTSWSTILNSPVIITTSFTPQIENNIMDFDQLNNGFYKDFITNELKPSKLKDYFQKVQYFVYT